MSGATHTGLRAGYPLVTLNFACRHQEVHITGASSQRLALFDRCQIRLWKSCKQPWKRCVPHHMIYFWSGPENPCLPAEPCSVLLQWVQVSACVFLKACSLPSDIVARQKARVC